MPIRRHNAPFLLVAVLALLAGLWAGVVRLPWPLPPLRPTLPMAHGPLMIGGFLGALIGLERAVGLTALDRRYRWTYAAPAAAGLGGLLLTAGVPGLPGPLLVSIGSAVLLVAMLAVVRLQPLLHTRVMALGAASWLVGNLLWLFGRGVPEVVLWWSGFLVLTIVGERLELSRLLQLTPGRRLSFLAGVVLFVAGLALSVAELVWGARLAGLGMVALAGWLLAYDIARRTVRKDGLTRYIAVALLVGYAWLGVAGLLGLRYGGATAGLPYDAWLHALLVGFVFSMIFAHAPIILPAVTGLAVPFHRRFYAPFALLQVSLLLRVVGDLATWMPGRRWGGLLNAIAILLFLATLVMAVLSGRRSGRG
ncbi:MAG: hypothetical protein NZ528_02415 [Caldilineales bacterium]|nr:hypothetical protein [Caldilineales bacterium]MDW8318213.1 hypothetical protein [Anaerolineae bacterium]